MVPSECPKHPSLSEQPANEITASSHSLQGVCIELHSRISFHD